MPRAQDVARRLEAIEAEMQRIGRWQQEPLSLDQQHPMQAFGADVMAFHQWLPFVFAARVREAIATDALPANSSVSVKAVRGFDGDDGAARLVTLLCEFDALID
jgi:uncharacterized protein YqcC (DUF446 family)